MNTLHQQFITPALNAWFIANRPSGECLRAECMGVLAIAYGASDKNETDT